LAQPITGMVAGAGAALRWLTGAPPDVEKAKAALLGVQTAGERAGEMILSIRATLRADAEARSPVNVNDLLEHALLLAQDRLDRHLVSVGIALDAAVPRVSANEVQFRHLLLNLIMNAADAMASNPVPSRLLQLQTAQRGHEVVVSVAHPEKASRGAGIAKLLAWMFTADKAESAIRLTICRAIVEAHGGRIWIARGSATAVHFTVPCAASRVHNAAV
jgi:C4-dicarboxylate-specific signal transduction histidine kinase